MNEEVPITTLLLGFVGVVYVGHQIEKQRHKLRQIFNVFDRTDCRMAEMLEAMVASGELKPYLSAPPA